MRGRARVLGATCLMSVLGPSIELVENPGELAAPAGEPIAAAGIAVQNARIDELSQPGGQDRRADPGAFAQLGEGVGVPAELPDHPQRPAPAEEVKNGL